MTLEINFCTQCNPDKIYNEARPYAADRRVLKEYPPDGIERRIMEGRRPSDGCSWFVGSPKEAVADGWYSDFKEILLCPKCRSWEI